MGHRTIPPDCDHAIPPVLAVYCCCFGLVARRKAEARVPLETAVRVFDENGGAAQMRSRHSAQSGGPGAVSESSRTYSICSGVRYWPSVAPGAAAIHVFLPSDKNTPTDSPRSATATTVPHGRWTNTCVSCSGRISRNHLCTVARSLSSACSRWRRSRPPVRRSATSFDLRKRPSRSRNQPMSSPYAGLSFHHRLIRGRRLVKTTLTSTAEGAHQPRRKEAMLRTLRASRTAVLVCQGRAAADGLIAPGRFTDPTAMPLLRADERAAVQWVRDAVAPRQWQQRVDYETVRANAE